VQTRQGGGAAAGAAEGTLGELVEALEQSRAAAMVVDDEGRLAWVSEQMLLLSGADADSEVGIGEHVEEVLTHPVWRAVLTAEAVEDLHGSLGARLDGATGLPPLWVQPLDLQFGGRRRGVGMLGVSLRHDDGAVIGTALIFAPLLPARVLALVSEGDEAMFTRMADLSTPAPRPSAVVFADIDGSGPLSRRLPTPAYFELIRGITTAFDDLVARHQGITGKHAGDGASAFFLAGTHGSDSGAARAALEVVQALPAAVRDVVAELAEDGVGIDPDDCLLNVGAHWGANLYIGQVVTGGRLEVTALGDEVNECARVEGVATGGQRLATKTLLERLSDDDAAALGLAPRSLTYRLLADMADDDAKARRDAGALAVHALS
jgi:class 3 adenylate cyclase